MVRRGALCLGAGVLLVILAGAADAQQPAIQPVTLATGGNIQAFAQDGGWIAWVDAQASCARRVHLRRVSGGPTTFLSAAKGPACSNDYSYQHQMALAGTRAAWVGVIGGLSTLYLTLWASAPERDLGSFEVQSTKAPSPPLPLAGDGPSLVYAHPGGSAGRLAKGMDEPIPGTGGTIGVAVAGTTLAAARTVSGCDVCMGSLSWSADGGRLLFASRGDSYVVDAAGASSRRVGIEASGTWAPRGRAIMFEDADRGRPALVFYEERSRLRRVLVRGETVNPTWSPDGSRIAFQRDDGLYTVGTGGGVRRVASGKVRSFQWSPDSARLAVEQDGKLTVVPGRGGRAVSVVSARGVGAARWSPGGDRIAYEVERAGKKTLEIAARDGSSTRRVVTADVLQFLPEWSPDGTRLAFLGRDGVYVVAADGTGLKRLAAGDPYDYPRWSPDGRWVAFVLRQGPDADHMDYVVYAAEPSGPARRLDVFEWVQFGTLAWSPSSRRLRVETGGGIAILAPAGGSVVRLPVGASSSAWSPDGLRLAYVRQTEPAGLVVGDETGASPRVLTRLPSPVPAWNGVELRSLVRNATPVRFAVDGLPVAVALSPTRVAMIVERAGRKHIEVHARTGRLERSFAVPRSTSADLGTFGRWTVYRVFKTIWGLDAATGRSRLLATAKETPVGLSVEGNRVAWAEQTEPSRIRAVLLAP